MFLVILTSVEDHFGHGVHQVEHSHILLIGK